MISKRAVLSDAAKSDLRELEAYIAEHGGEARAAKVRKRLNEVTRKLASRSNLESTRAYLPRGRRAFSVPPWIVVYSPLPEDGVLVQRILDSRRDLVALFRKKR